MMREEDRRVVGRDMGRKVRRREEEGKRCKRREEERRKEN